MFYILENKRPVPVVPAEYYQWAALNNTQRLWSDQIGDIDISTVFLGLDHGRFGGIPILFETMVFGGPDDQHQVRYCTWEEAEKGHQRAVNMVKGGNILQENDLL